MYRCSIESLKKLSEFITRYSCQYGMPPIMLVFASVMLQAIYAQENNVFYSQSGQDAFAYKRFFSNKPHGVFIDIGAHNGITFSNSYFFEKHLGWHGLCVEPIPEVFQQLAQNRSCICVEGCVYDIADTVGFLLVQGACKSSTEHIEMLSGIVDNYDPKHLQRVNLETANGRGSSKEIIVKCYSINELLEANKLYHVDYMSIDTEGGELDILKSIHFSRFTIDVIDVENNYNDPEFESFMSTKGYKKLSDGPCRWDEVYVRSEWYATLEQ